ncbi:hypothetical protein [Tepidimicrobium xylanilyticum]|uniref:Arginase family protein n=1 Tax=Tepidimicrobium xylanilyticum TaxID=1123352 RepID=A0A1H2TDN8_9FIRM|nr:hypothetical protein [Tepidimicrobium xylanilyticum]GMG95980.1 arginase [Tepidimicrobium xylanilyticum]SDW41374.1 hypothetical protein SAMN05660923_00676 [Tepidimicrobium xylanilyticum]
MVNILSIDWDYFIPLKREWTGSYMENNRYRNLKWYERYFDYKRKGQNLETTVNVDSNLLNSFINDINTKFKLDKANIYVSDSHKTSYYIAKENKCNTIYSFDAHTDLGYGGLNSLQFEVNCANWLGKLLWESFIDTAYIILSPYSFEHKDQFKEINSKFNIEYITMDEIKDLPDISFIHIARSGAWTPPWLDHHLFYLIDSFNKPYTVLNLKHRHWNPEDITLADMLGNII